MLLVMKKKLHTTIKKVSAPFILVLGLIFGFLADRISIYFFSSGHSSAKTEHADGVASLAPAQKSFVVQEPKRAAKPKMAKLTIPKARPSALVCSPVKAAKGTLAKKSKKKTKKISRLSKNG